MTRGIVKKVIADRGFGFITADDGKDYFFHRSGLEPTLDFDRLVGGERVAFEIEASPKGPRAARRPPRTRHASGGVRPRDS